MRIRKGTGLAAATALGLFLMTGARPDVSMTSTLTLMSPEISSIGAIAFGPENILFVGDSEGAGVFALDVADDGRGSGDAVSMLGVDTNIAALLGTTADEIVINDLAVHPGSHNVYLGVTRGRGEGSVPVLLMVSASGDITEVGLDGMHYSRAEILNAPGPDQTYGRRGSARTFTVTDLAFAGSEVLVAGLSNEEFASNFRRIAFPFGDEFGATSLEIYHVSHRQNETHAPIMTFLPTEVDGAPTILAAYTCTPLVAFDMSGLANGGHVFGKTIAELGAGNRPLDIIRYEVAGEQQILISNSRHPLMKVDPGLIPGAARLLEPGETGVGFTAVQESGIRQMDNLNADYIVLLQDRGEGLELRSLRKDAL